MSKYGNRKTAFDGMKFDSAKEARRYAELKLLEKNGDIQNLRTQVRYELIPPQYRMFGGKQKLVERGIAYVADFVYEENGQTVVEDAKGMRTKEYIIKRKLMLFVHNIAVVEV